MWLLANKTPFAADYAWVVDKEGNKHWLVVVKAAFTIQQDGTCCLSADNLPVFQVAQAYGEFGKTSLRYETDLGGIKPTTDILVCGDAIAPQGKKVTELDVLLRVDSISKHLRVTGDRVWENSLLGGIKASAPVPFERMPIVYERAYGGWDRSAARPEDHRLEARNPVGTGFSIRSENCANLHLPNVEYPDQLIVGWNDKPTPAGFNVVDCAWTPRRELAGTYDEYWRKHRFPLWATDFNSRYYNCAPSDQQSPKYLVGGERVNVVNMSEGGLLSFELPRVRPFFRTRFGSERIDHEGQLCTVVVEPNIRRVIIAWQTSLICNRKADQLDETLVVEKFGV